VRDGIVYSFDLPVKLPGGVQFRVAVRIAAPAASVRRVNLSIYPTCKMDGWRCPELWCARKTPPSGWKPYRRSGRAGAGSAPFHQGENAVFAYVIFNGNQSAQLTAQTRVFHDGKMIFSSDPVPVNVQGQTDLSIWQTAVACKLASDMLPAITFANHHHRFRGQTEAARCFAVDRF